MDNKQLLNVFDRWSFIYDRDKFHSYFNDTLNIMLNNIPSDSTVLDVGCGTGMYSIELAKRGYRVKGFDYSEKMVEKAIENMNREKVKIDFRPGNAQDKIPFEGKFNYAISMGTWEYFSNPIEVLKASPAVGPAFCF